MLVILKTFAQSTFVTLPAKSSLKLLLADSDNAICYTRNFLSFSKNERVSSKHDVKNRPEKGLRQIRMVLYPQNTTRTQPIPEHYQLDYVLRNNEPHCNINKWH